MRLLVLFFFAVATSLSGQTKKEQIINLQSKYDSLLFVINHERSISNDTVNKLKSTITSLENKIKIQENKINNLLVDSDLLKKNQAGLSYQLNLKNDSLHFSVKELNNLKQLLIPNDGKIYTHYIGEEFGGGIVFHLWKDEQGKEHGYIIDKTDLSIAQSFSNIINKRADAFYSSGLDNSQAIAGQAGHRLSAASLCLNSINRGYEDWFLPSISEWNLIADNLTIINKNGAMIEGTYWTSDEDYYVNTQAGFASDPASGAVSVDLGNSKTEIYRTGHDDKSSKHQVRAIRSF
jgi:hypothetical protein